MGNLPLSESGEGLTARDGTGREKPDSRGETILIFLNHWLIMKLRYLLAVGFVSMLSAAAAQEPLGIDDYKATASFAKAVENLGEISRDADAVEVRFPFHNSGNAPLVLTYVKASCSCIRLQYPRDPVAPGDSAAIAVTFLPSSVGERQFKRSIIVKSNDENSPAKLYITGKILPSE